jgi:hypothetical protein
MNMMRKGHIQVAAKGTITDRVKFMAKIFEVAA